MRARRGGNFETYSVLGGYFGVFDSQHPYPSLTPLLCSLYCPGAHVLPSLENTLASTLGLKQVDCDNV